MNPEDGPDMVDPEYDHGGPPPGFNGAPPQRPQSSSPHAPPLYQTLNAQIASNFHIVIILGVILYFAARWVHNYWSNYYRPPPSNPSTMMRNLEAMQEARKRQAEKAKLAAAVDAQKEKERRERALEEQRQNKDTRNGVYEEIPLIRKAPSSAAQPRPMPPPRKKDDDDDGNNPRPLPKLSGGDRADWQSNQSGGGGDRPNRFKRDCGPRGG